PRFPPRKARNSPRLINFLINQLGRFQPIKLNYPSKTRFDEKEVWEILTITSLQKTSISRKTREFRERKNKYPSGETILRWLKKSSTTELNQNQEICFLKFLNALPAHFQQVRKKGMILAIDFHKDPNYAKQDSEYIFKSVPKASTNKFYRYLTVLWVNAPQPITLAVRMVKSGTPIHSLALAILEPILAQEKVSCVLADGRFYNRRLVKFLVEKSIFFVIRACLRSKKVEIAGKWQDYLKQPNQGVIIDWDIKRSRERAFCPMKMLLWKEKGSIIELIFPKTSNLSPEEVRSLYRKRFAIETYYRMMHRFQAFSCSRNPSIRFILVLLAFWLCNFWAYFRAVLQLLKPVSRSCKADKIYTANDFCEFILSSWISLNKTSSKSSFRR
ncbi:MAG: transposase, partial [Candidatus Heimdallarchaeota archaeon]|nr:transposase [Candidatus Heimdallarchaeota archaeon]